MHIHTILVTGATGNIGRPLVNSLVDAGARVRAVTRDPVPTGLPDAVEIVPSAAAGLDGSSAVFLPLTGPQSLTNTELVAELGRALGRTLRYREVPPDVVRERFLAIGFPAAFGDAYLGLLSHTIDSPADVTDDVATILGRPATTFAQWAAESRHDFAPASIRR